MSSLLSTSATRRSFNARQLDTVQRVIEAALDELRDVGFEAMTLRTVAARASVAPATVYNYFSSKNHLVVEIFWRLLNERGRHENALPTACERVCAVFFDLADLLESEPTLGPAVTAALLGPEPDVKQLRSMIGIEINSRIAQAAAGSVSDEQLDGLTLAWSGALLQAGMGHSNYRQMGQRLATTTALMLAGTQ